MCLCDGREQRLKGEWSRHFKSLLLTGQRTMIQVGRMWLLFLPEKAFSLTTFLYLCFWSSYLNGHSSSSEFPRYIWSEWAHPKRRELKEQSPFPIPWLPRHHICPISVYVTRPWWVSLAVQFYKGFSIANWDMKVVFSQVSCSLTKWIGVGRTWG